MFPMSPLEDITFPSGTVDDDVLTIDGGDTLNFDDYPTAFTAFADNDDSIAHHIDLGIGSTVNVDTLNLDFSGIELIYHQLVIVMIQSVLIHQHWNRNRQS